MRMLPKELANAKREWEFVAGEPMPAVVKRWPLWRVASALRLLKSDLVCWDADVERLRMRRLPTVADLHLWSDALGCEVMP